jgi:hypothetical protein
MKIIRQLLIFEMIIFALSFVMYLSWLFLPVTPMQLIGPYKVKTPVVVQGGNLIYTAHACRNTMASGIVEYSLTDDIVYTFAQTTTLNRPKGCGYKDVLFNIPSVIHPGTYHLHLKATYQINPVRTFIVEVDTENFTVVAK